jgi:tetratricopeptide (TPR) repeat protein
VIGVCVNDDLAELLAAGERAAFHGRPASGVPPLQSAFEQARAEGRGAEATAAAWLLGVCLGAAGKFGSALAVLDPLAAQEGTDIPERRLFAALAAATSASVRRQLGQHVEAKAMDERALGLANGGPEATFDALLGLAADAVGLGDATFARHHLQQAAELAAPRTDWWRQKVRLAWIQAEAALLEGDPAAAAEVLAPAIQSAEVSGAPRHVAKSLLFLGVAQVQSGQLQEAEGTLRRAATLAESLGAIPLLWPARALLGALLEERSPAEAAKSLSAARGAVIAIADDLPEGLRTVWLDRPDVAALLGG